MEWITRLNQAVLYIEAHLTGPIDYEHLGQIALCSSYQFQRMFGYLADVSLSEYIRRRKMSLAAVDLQKGQRVVDVALKYGYQSPTAFNRAFQAVHHIPPSAVKKEGAVLKSFPPITFQMQIKGVEEMTYRIETKESFSVLGVSTPLYRELEKNHEILPQKWNQVFSDGTMDRLMTVCESPAMGVLGVCVCLDQEPWRYYIAVPSSRTGTDFESYTVPAATWAIFSGYGAAQDLQNLQQQVLTQWLPSSGYRLGSGPDLEVYLDMSGDKFPFEIWIPVEKA